MKSMAELVDTNRMKAHMPLNPALSTYLDSLRFTAALIVLLGHMNRDGLYTAWAPFTQFGHESVMVFFVLSGFIIYHSTTSKNSTLQKYAVARLSRIYSVAIPAVCFSVVAAIVISQSAEFQPEHLGNYKEPSTLSTLSSLLFLNESYLNPATLTLNNPYWSLCYEVWFYVIFGAFYFTRRKLRYLAVTVAALIAGPAILVLMPVWLMGAALAASGKYKSHWSHGWAWAGFLAPLAVIFLIRTTGLDWFVQSALYENVPGYWRLDFSQRFVTDYLIGLSLCLHIAAFSSLPQKIQAFFVRHQSTFVALAGFSFTLYLFHRPLTQIIGAYFPVASGQFVQSFLLILALLVVCWMISWGTEKQLPLWRRQFSRLISGQRMQSA